MLSERKQRRDQRPFRVGPIATGLRDAIRPRIAMEIDACRGYVR